MGIRLTLTFPKSTCIYMETFGLMVTRLEGNHLICGHFLTNCMQVCNFKFKFVLLLIIWMCPYYGGYKQFYPWMKGLNDWEIWKIYILKGSKCFFMNLSLYHSWIKSSTKIISFSQIFEKSFPWRKFPCAEDSFEILMNILFVKMESSKSNNYLAETR